MLSGYRYRKVVTGSLNIEVNRRNRFYAGESSYYCGIVTTVLNGYTISAVWQQRKYARTVAGKQCITAVINAVYRVG
jgi:hypothetical protein